MFNKLKNLFKESFIYSTGSLLVKLGGFIIMPLYIDFTTREEFGLIMLFEVVFQFMQTISGWGLKGGFQRWYYDMKTEKAQKSLFFTSFFMTIFTTLLATTAVFLVLNIFTFDIFKYQVSPKVILLFSSAAFLRMLLDIPFILLRLQQKAARQTFYQTFNIVITILVTYATLRFLKLGLEGVYWGQLIANGLTFLVVIPIIIRNSYLKFLKKTMFEMMRFGAPLILSNVLTIVFSLSDRYIINIYKSLADVGSFSVAFKIASIVQFVVLAPFFTSYSYDYYRYMNSPSKDRYYIKSFTYFIFLMSIAGIGIVLFSKEVIFVLAAGDSSFFEAIPLIPIMILGIIFSGMRMVFTLPLQKAKRTRKISSVLIFTGVLNFGLNLLIIPYWGKIGAAITTVISQLTGAIWFYHIIKKQENDTYELVKIAKAILLASTIMYGYILLPKIHIVADYAIKIIAIPTFILLMYWFRCFESIELKKMLYAWKKWKDPRQWSTHIKKLKKKQQ